MKQLFYALVTTFLLFAVRSKGDCQPMPGNQKTIDSLTHQLEVGQFDTNRVKTLVHLARIYTTIKPALTLKYANRGLSLSKTLNYPYGSIISLQAIIFASAITGEWKIATESVYRGLEFCKNHYTIYTIGFYNLFALVQEKQNNNKKRLEWLLKAYHHPLFKYASPSMFQGITFYNLGEVYEILNKLDSAQYFIQKANVIAQQYNSIAIQGFTNRISGRIAAKKGNYSESLFHFHRALHLAHQMDNYLFEAENNLELAKTFHATNQADSAIYYATLALEKSKDLNNEVVISEASKILGEEFEIKKPELAVGHFKTMIAANDSLYNLEKLQQTQNIIDLEQQRIRDLKAAKTQYDQNIKQNTFFGILATLAILMVMLILNNKQKQNANILLIRQKEEIQSTLFQLKSTQAQLIQSEKLASLGELTAGIAHEIQNPLNFVNNFAEVSAEMLDEMQEELEKGDTTEAIAIATDLKTNLEKINHHGQRASSIVKGMLEHSRASTGVKEPTDLNALADEFLRLAYHGLRAKDNNFNTTLKTHFDPELPLVSVIPQDIGRVLLNLINNAFYAVQQRTVETLHATSLQNPPYQPTVTVSTQKTGDQIIIKVQDNGNGIPEAIKDKIFQPFFTTKPTGQGTGLGLSLAYDIVTKGHGGTLEVDTKKGESTTMIIRLPLQ
ncbi:sensor histidine kinase [Haliscomenobacter sp.]|uniref:sensor histidine kinase n=1 Tax=Haliscomenobacter sp. TaxID=2717303 RepID=UPI003BAA7E53